MAQRHDDADGAPTASFVPLTPTAFLRRAALVHRDRLAVVDGELRLTYAQLWERARRLAGALVARGDGDGARVAVLAANSHVLLEAHYGVPLAGGVLVALNMRLSAPELAYILDHAGARTVIADPAQAPLAHAAVALAQGDVAVIDGGADYERMLDGATPAAVPVADERELLAINYTSGTTGQPKGVMYHHRGAYLQALAMAFHTGLRPDSAFLWTLPMFHCNGWCFTWAVTAAGATHVCLPRVDPAEIWRLLRAEGITHFNAAPTVLTSLAYHPEADAQAPSAGAVAIRVATGGAPPSPALLERLAQLGMDVTHLYGLTETFGPVVICDWHPEWDELPGAERARLKARQGVPNVIAGEVRVLDAQGADVPPDGATVGEVAVRGNDVMLGYYRDPEATARTMGDGWMRTGDLAVMHDDGYLELRDRAKDVIVSGGENIASVELEQALASHPAVLDAAVVPIPDERWGERPLAFVVLKPGQSASGEALAAHLRERIARFKVPDRFELVDELPRTSTGKVRKFELREPFWAGRERRIG